MLGMIVKRGQPKLIDYPSKAKADIDHQNKFNQVWVYQANQNVCQSKHLHIQKHGLQTPNEGMNQRNLKIWPMWQTKYASPGPKNFVVGVDFCFCTEGRFLIRCP